MSVLLSDKSKIAALIPHGYDMCLIDRVLECSKDGIKCETTSHLKQDHPLLHHGRLHSVILIEYASQVAAIHATLNDKQFSRNKAAYVGSVKNFKLECQILSDINQTLLIEALCIFSNPQGAIYTFEVTSAKIIAQGQINLVLPN